MALSRVVAVGLLFLGGLAALSVVTAIDPAAPASAASAEAGMLRCACTLEAAEVDGHMLRAAVTGAIANIVAERTRPSRFLGEGSPLGNGLDGLWGVGEQAALSVLLEGEMPEPREVERQALAVAAAAGQREVAELIGSATQYGLDNDIPFLRNLEVSASWAPGNRPGIEARSIDSLFQTAALDHTLFLEAGVRTDFADTTANVGLGYRYQRPGSDWMFGANAFYDREFPIGHQRMSIGVEASTSDFALFANRYVALSGWLAKDADFDERALSGWDVGVAGQMPGVEDLRLTLSAFHWEEETEKDRTGLRLSGDYGLGPNLQLGMSLAGDGSGDVEAGFRLSVLLGGEGEGGGGASLRTNRRLRFVERDNTIRAERREVPRGYAVSFAEAEVNPSNETALGFQLTGAPQGSSYSYSITSSAGGPVLTGSGLVRESPQPIGGIDVSGLRDGMLTLTLQLISKQGATGPEVTARIAKSTSGLSVSTSALSPSPTKESPIRYRIAFSRAVSGLDISGLDVKNGTADDPVTADGAVWTVDVTPLAQGAVTLQVKAGAVSVGGTPNPASNIASVIFDSAAPAGYAVSFLASPITATAFEIRNAEVGAHFRYTIASSGGGTPVTGTGAISAALQQVTGLDLSSLADGTLTLTLTLTDALGNEGQPVTDTMTKDAAPPFILSITPPAPGLFDDL